MDGRCKDCRRWRRDEPDEVDTFAYKQEGWGYCVATEMIKGPEAGTRAYALDGEGYWAMLHTAPDFGCVEFEPKE